MGDGKLFLGACLVGGLGLWWFKSTYGRWPWEPATLAQARFNRPTVRRITRPTAIAPKNDYETAKIWHTYPTGSTQGSQMTNRRIQIQQYKKAGPSLQPNLLTTYHVG